MVLDRFNGFSARQGFSDRAFKGVRVRNIESDFSGVSVEF